MVWRLVPNELMLRLYRLPMYWEHKQNTCTVRYTQKTRKQEPLLASVGLCSNIPYVCTLYTLVDRKLVTVKDMTRNGYLQRLLVEPMFLILHLPCSVYGMSVWCLATGVSYSADFLSLCVLVHLLWPTRSYFYFNVDRRQSSADLDDFTYTGICLYVSLSVSVLVDLLWSGPTVVNPGPVPLP